MSLMDQFNPHDDAKVSLYQWAKVQGTGMMTVLYHARFLIGNRETIIKKLKNPQLRANVEALTKAPPQHMNARIRKNI